MIFHAQCYNDEQLPRLQFQCALATAFLLATSYFILATATAFAAEATLYLFPDKAKLAIGEAFTLTLAATTNGERVSAIEGRIEFDPKDFEIVSVDKSVSVLGVWTIEPAPEHERGAIAFSGLMGTSSALDKAKILDISLRPLRVGERTIRLSAGAAISGADQASGNIVTTLSGATFLVEANDTEATRLNTNISESSGEVLGVATDESFFITSETFPDENTWYATRTGKFSWKNRSDVTAVLLGFGTMSNVKGSVPYVPPIAEREISDLPDGTMYFHVTQIYADGSEATRHLRFQVDTIAPQGFAVAREIESDAFNPHATFVVTSATDTHSGITRYEFMLDDGSPVHWSDDGNGRYRVLTSGAGEHALVARALDGAGNSAEKKLTFSIDSLPAPVITAVKDGLIEGDPLELRVTAEKNSLLTFTIFQDGAGVSEKFSPMTEDFTMNADGSASYQSRLQFPPGKYSVKAVARNENGAMSLESAAVGFAVNATVLGAIERHPLIPYAAGSAVLLMIFAFVAWRRFRRSEPSTAERLANRPKELSELHPRTFAQATKLSPPPEHERVAPANGGPVTSQDGFVTRL